MSNATRKLPVNRDMKWGRAAWLADREAKDHTSWRQQRKRQPCAGAECNRHPVGTRKFLRGERHIPGIMGGSMNEGAALNYRIGLELSGSRVDSSAFQVLFHKRTRSYLVKQ